MSEHLSSRTHDVWALGELDGEELARAEAHVAACARCRDERAARAALHAEFSRRVLPRTLPVVRAAIEGRARRWRPAWLAVPVLAMAAIVLVVALPREREVTPDGDIRIKGDAALEVIARRGDRIWRVADGSTLAAGDEIRFVIRPGAATHVLVASVDGAGVDTVYHPFRGARSARLPAGPRVELPGSIALDAAPGPERVFACLTRAPVDAADVEVALEALGAKGGAAIRAARRLDAPCDAQATMWFEKAAP